MRVEYSFTFEHKCSKVELTNAIDWRLSRMRTPLYLTGIFLIILALAAPARADEGLTLGRFLICKKIKDREPVGVTSTFPEGTSKVYAFIEALDVAEETSLKVLWIYEGKETAIIDLSIGKSKRWRTFSSKRIGKRTGSWEVRLLDSKDNTLRAQKFTVQ